MKITIDTNLIKPLANLGPSYLVNLDDDQDGRILTITEILHVLSEVLLNETVPRYMNYTKKEDLDPEETQP